MADVGDEVNSEGEPNVDAEEVVDLTAEQVVAADTAMLLDLGGAEALASGIAAQSVGGDTVVDRRPAPDSESEADEAEAP